MRVINLFLHTKGAGHRRTGLEIWGRGADTNLPIRKILKNRVSLMPFPAFWCGFLEQVTNEKNSRKTIKRSLRVL